MKIEFDRELWDWSDDWLAVVLDLDVDGLNTGAVIWGDTLHELFNADFDDAQGMREAYLRNQRAIDGLVCELIEKGQLDEDRCVYVETKPLAAYMKRHKIKPDPVSALV